MKTVHLLFTCDIGGIEVLCRDYAKYSKKENLFLVIKGRGLIAKEIKELGGNVIELEEEKAGALSALRTAIKICTGDDVSCIITHHEAPISNVIMGISKLLNPHVITVAYAHSAAENMLVKNGGLKAIASNLILKCSMRFSDRIIAISEFVKKTVIKDFKVSEQKVYVVYNGTELTNSAPMDSEQHDKRNLIYVGRLIREKGVQNILKALSDMNGSCNYHFTVVGDGPYRKELEKLTESLQISDKVEFLGNRRDVRKLLSKAGVFIHMPECEEGFGLTVIEALASGLICVCANRGALPETLDNGRYGFIVKDTAELTAILEYIIYEISDNEYAARSQLARDRARFFSAEKYAAKLDEITNQKI